jgi:hypothetical protein
MKGQQLSFIFCEKDGRGSSGAYLSGMIKFSVER